MVKLTIKIDHYTSTRKHKGWISWGCPHRWSTASTGYSSITVWIYQCKGSLLPTEHVHRLTHTREQHRQPFLSHPLGTRPSGFYSQSHGVVALPSLCNQLGQFLVINSCMCVAPCTHPGSRLPAKSQLIQCSYSPGVWCCLAQTPMSRRRWNL